ncbi:MAG: hypothetical protein AAFQ79_07750 [Pseudomonadota bacterium]
MATTLKTWIPRFGVLCRTSAVALIAGVYRRSSIQEVNDHMVARPLQQQVLITPAVLGALFALSALAAQFGWIGMLLFWIAVIVLVN